jgi:uncharacterized protein YlxW (UPF0749 family)
MTELKANGIRILKWVSFLQEKVDDVEEHGHDDADQGEHLHAQGTAFGATVGSGTGVVVSVDRLGHTLIAEAAGIALSAF